MTKIAVIGSGISGLSAAWLLHQKHQVTLYEAAGYLGGHTNTVDVTLDGVTHPVDTGFLVHNDLTYPNLIRLLNHLGIDTYESEMSFSVKLPEVDIEWAGTNLATVFGQKRNLLRLQFWRMLKDAGKSERDILGAISYQSNTAKLHTDRRFLPHRESLWSAWNYMSLGDDCRAVCVTYLLNQLQKLPFKSPLMVTLNPPPDLKSQGEIAHFEYAHPVFDQDAIDAQTRLASIQGRNKAWFCGAWCGYGFHEDGLKSALHIIGDFGVEAPWPAVL